MLLQHLHWYSEGKDGAGDVRVTNGAIEQIGRGLAPRANEQMVDLRDCLALPGLINAHDHFEWNVLQIHGHPPYSNFVEYAADIHRPNESPIRELLKIDFRDRLLWGGYKNLISAATTVCHHNPYDAFFENDFPVRTVKNVGWSHSLKFSKNVLKDFKKARGRPFIIHAAEGTDQAARSEIAQLDRLGILQNNTVIVHGIALLEEEISLLERAGAALIWCPASNLHIYSQTTPISKLRGRVPVALGTDSCLTGAPTLFEELKMATRTGMVTAGELLELVTTSAAQILKLPSYAGTLQEGGAADLIVLPDKAATPAETLLQSQCGDIALIMVNGRIKLASQIVDGFESNIIIDGEPKYLYGSFSKLKTRIANAVGANMIAPEKMPLWQRLRPITDL